MPTRPEQSRNRRVRTDAGFSILEVMIAASLLAIALLGHTASLFSEHKLSSSERARSVALIAAEQFMERLRSDDDWSTLYDRLLVLDLKADVKGGPETLTDGRRVYRPQAYYDDFVTPSGLDNLHVLVDVPTAPSDSGVVGEIALREDVSMKHFSLPADLNGDGVIDTAARDDDYRVLPVVVTFRWSAPEEADQEFSIASWLWGYR